MGFLVKSDISRSIKNFTSMSDRVCIPQLDTTPIASNLIQVYAPTCDGSDDKIETFYSHIKRALELTKSSKVNIIMGDFNAKVGRGRREDVVGDHVLGTPNDRRNRIVKFCQEENLIIANTQYKQSQYICLHGS